MESIVFWVEKVTFRKFSSISTWLMKDNWLNCWRRLQKLCRSSRNWRGCVTLQRTWQKVHFPFYSLETYRGNSSCSNKQFHIEEARTRSWRDPSIGFKKVDLFIVVKQWSIVLPQHERSICGCWWKIENWSYFFPSSLFYKLQDILECYYKL